MQNSLSAARSLCCMQATELLSLFCIYLGQASCQPSHHTARLPLLCLAYTACLGTHVEISPNRLQLAQEASVHSVSDHLILWCSVQVAAREVLNQRLCFQHPHIIQFREVFLTANHLALVNEYAAGGDLADYIDRHQAKHKRAGLTEGGALWLFHQLVTGVNFCHQVSQLAH